MSRNWGRGGEGEGVEAEAGRGSGTLRPSLLSQSTDPVLADLAHGDAPVGGRRLVEAQRARARARGVRPPRRVLGRRPPGGRRGGAPVAAAVGEQQGRASDGGAVGQQSAEEAVLGRRRHDSQGGRQGEHGGRHHGAARAPEWHGARPRRGRGPLLPRRARPSAPSRVHQRPREAREFRVCGRRWPRGEEAGGRPRAAHRAHLAAPRRPEGAARASSRRQCVCARPPRVRGGRRRQGTPRAPRHAAARATLAAAALTVPLRPPAVAPHTDTPHHARRLARRGPRRRPGHARARARARGRRAHASHRLHHPRVAVE